MKNKLGKTILWVVILSVFCICVQDYSYARRGRKPFHGRRGYRHSRRFHGGHSRHHIFHPAMFFLGLITGLVIDPLPARVEVIHVLPPRHTKVIFHGEPFYYYGGIYYRRYQSGYVTVPESEIEELRKLQKMQEQSSEKSVEVEEGSEKPVEIKEGEDYVVNIPNSDDSFTPVKLKKHKDGYIGPQGEFYPDKPTIKQLKVLYGK